MSAQQPPELDLDPGATRIRQRLRALRSRYAGVALTTELTHIHDDQVVVRAVISFPDGTAVSAFAAEPTDSTGLLDGALELAEQRATARALDLLGVGDVPTASRRETPAAGDEAATERRSAPPESAPPPIVRPDEAQTPSVVEALRRGTVSRGARPEPEPAPPAERPDQRPDATPRSERPVADPPRQERPVVERPPADPADRERSPQAEAPRRERPEPAATPPQPRPARPEPAATPPDTRDEPDMADYTWTHFWTWARGHNLSTKGQVEQRIGRSIDGQTPQDVRQWLHEAGVPR